MKLKLTIGREICKFEDIIFDKYYLQSKLNKKQTDSIIMFKWDSEECQMAGFTEGRGFTFFRTCWTLEGKYNGRTINSMDKKIPFEYNKLYEIENQDEVAVLVELLK